MRVPFRDIPLNVFHPCVMPEPNSGCWLWTGATNGLDYGVMWSPEGAIMAHRESFKQAGNVLPDDLCALHKCDNPFCVNPNHLFAGTKADNNADKVAKGRQAGGEGWGEYLRPFLPRGEGHKNALLTDDAVRDIRRSVESGPILAQKYGISRTTISRIRRRKGWTHVED